MHPARTVFKVNADVTPASDGRHGTVALDTQGHAGQIHYTLDGSAVDRQSPLYQAPFQVAFPASLHALAFAEGVALGEPAAQRLTLSDALARDSRVLDACKGNAGIQMEQDPPRSAERPVFRVVFSNPCWIYRRAEMTNFSSLTLSVASIPYIFHGQNKPLPQPSASPTTAARIAIHADACDGKLIATVPLQPAYRKDGAVTLPAVRFDQQQGTHDLCFQVENADPATVWLLHTVQPIPNPQR